MGPESWEPARPLQRSLGPSLEMSPPAKLSKKSGTLQKHSPDTFQRLSGDFPDCPRDFFETFGGPAGDIFETLSAFRARSARETSVRGGLVPYLRGYQDLNSITKRQSSKRDLGWTTETRLEVLNLHDAWRRQAVLSFNLLGVDNLFCPTFQAKP